MDGRLQSGWATRWKLQSHDVYDLAAPPVLFDVTLKGKKIPAVAQLTKTGAVFILNRLTGEPIYGVEERKVPVDDALPGDSAWPTQAFPLKPLDSTTSVSPSQCPTEYPIHVGFGSLGS